MQSNYKAIGSYIQQVDVRNKEGIEDNLLGVSVSKSFMPSIANTVGTDFSKYKIVKKDQFTYIPDTSRRGDKMGIALLENYEEALVSQAYTVFEITEKEKLDPAYLMMWFRRPEFDRYARYKSHGSVREIFDWDEMCNVQLPIPSIDKQREIVAEYNTIKNRIALNEQLIQKLEETAQAIYKQWFVDFEFPDENGNPYRSSGGKMVWNEELDKEIPEGWEVKNIGNILKPKGYIRGPFGSALKKDDMTVSGYPVYEQQHAIDNHRNFRYYIPEEKYQALKRFSIKENDFVISCSGTLGKVTIINKMDPIGIINQALLILRVNETILNPICFFYFITSKEGNDLLIADASGSAQVNIAKREQVEIIPIMVPVKKEQDNVSKKLQVIYDSIFLKKKETKMLNALKEVLLSKLVTTGN